LKPTRENYERSRLLAVIKGDIGKSFCNIGRNKEMPQIIKKKDI
jgi:hypothetical protein